MDAAYTKKTAVVVLDDSEVRLIMKALDTLRYSPASAGLTGSMLVNLAGLSHEWLCMTQDMESPKKGRLSDADDIDRCLAKAVKGLHDPDFAWGAL